MPYDPSNSLALGQNPFAGSGVSPLAQVMQQARMQLASQPERLAPPSNQLQGDVNAALPEAYANPNIGVGAGLKNMIESLMTLPKRAIDASGADVQNLGDHSKPLQSIGSAVEAALAMMGGGAGGADAGMVLGSGPARMRMIENVDLFKELANQRRAQGMSVGRAAPGHDFKRPDAAKGSWQDLVDRTKAGWEGDKTRAISDYENAAPNAVPGSKYMSPADWAFIKQNGGLVIPAAVGAGGFGALAQQGQTQNGL